MGELTGGRAVVELLKAELVRYVFGIVGATFLDVLDALYDDRSVEYIKYARLFGAEGYYVDHPDQVGDALQAALSSGKPAVVEIPIDPDEFPTPVAAVRRR